MKDQLDNCELRGTMGSDIKSQISSGMDLSRCSFGEIFRRRLKLRRASDGGEDLLCVVRNSCGKRRNSNLSRDSPKVHFCLLFLVNDNHHVVPGKTIRNTKIRLALRSANLASLLMVHKSACSGIGAHLFLLART